MSPADTGTLSFLRGLPLTQQAVEFARERHGGQTRQADGAPFLVHPLEVAAMLERSGYPDEVVAAAVLHDVLEDTDTRAADLSQRFGTDICRLVALVSDDDSIEDEEARKDDVRERVRREGGYAPAVYAADKISKVRELRMLLAGGLDLERARVKLARYRRSLAMLEAVAPQDRLVEILRFELEALEALPPVPDEVRGSGD